MFFRLNDANISRCAFASVILCVFCAISNAQSDRPIDGFGYNQANPQWGAVDDIQTRLTASDYADGISIPKLGAEHGKENPRVISNVLFAQSEVIGAELALSDYTWVFGQFVDHDVVLTENSHEVLTNIVVPEDDEHFTPGELIIMSRNEAAEGTGLSVDNPREHVNRITAYLDLSSVYGSDEYRATWLRTLEDGKLKTSKGGKMLPWNTVDGDFNGQLDVNAPFMADDTRSLVKMYVAGDVRANENPLLIAFHTLFVREHNRLCELEKVKHPGWNDERLYQAARKKNIAAYQKVIFDEWLPALGVVLPSYAGYSENVNPQISNEFSSAAFRMGHTLINSNIIRMDNSGNELNSGSISLRDAFFNPLVVEYAGGVDPYFKGMATQIQQEFNVDAWVGMLAEPHVEDGLFGNLVTLIMERQFQALREGDRFYYKNLDFDQNELAEIEGTTMRDILMRNTEIALMQDEVFRAMPHSDIEGGPELIPFPLEAEIYPNPVKEYLQIKVYSSKTDNVDVSVIDYMGRVVATSQEHIYEGNNTIQIDIEACPRGYYNVILETQQRMNVLKMIKE